ncbi:hypothetical protein PCANC_19152 [Puccinia coronata f. sp. avenae]|uniref:Glycoside hydrolase family 71 protein n=1 Tax=Puccinia coronata f. sp. avenae TaxID=200324 RepID=A0A2N5SGT6_9BASI|nr:hypothetical protein PCANC_19152 [Puccinia coronata f. sp. avenae]
MRIVAGLIWGFWLASMNHSDKCPEWRSTTMKVQHLIILRTRAKRTALLQQRSMDRARINYTKEEWISDMKTAQAAHIDAFAINIGVDASNEVQLPMIYDSAKSLGFKVFIFFKTPSTISVPEQDVYLHIFWRGPGTFMDANQNYTAAWCTLKASLRGHGVNTYFVPGWTGIKPATSRCADGLLSWDAWPHNTDIPANFEQVNLNVTTQENLYFPDKAAMLASRAVSKTFAAPVAPLFYKHLNPAQTDNYIYRSDDWMMINRYTNLIKQDEPPEFIELLTWNDYGESHYLRDPQPTANLPSGMISAHQYVDGFSHTAFLNLLSYFNQWYKTGTPPTLDQTTMYIWYRPHVKNASATNDLLPAPEDRIYGYVIPAPNTSVSAVRILSGYQVLEQALFPLNDTSPSVNGSHLCQIVEDLSNNNEAEVDGTGILVSAPLEPGNQLLELLNDEGETLISLQGRPVEALPETYNFNYWSGSIAF